MDLRALSRRSFVAGLLALALFSALAGRAAAAGLIDPTPRIAVMSAFEPEWLALKAELAEPHEYKLNGRSFLTGRLGGKDVVLFLSGISMVNAAMNTQLALDRFSVSAVLFSGIAGGVDPSLHIGDVVIADQWGQYLESVFARETSAGFAIPPWMAKGDFEGFGMMMPRRVDVLREGANPESRFWFPGDPGLLAAARKAAAKIELAECLEANACLTRKPRIVIGGNGVSGQAFIDNGKFRDYVLKTFKAKLLDMESAAVAQVTYSNKVPFLAVRSLSDLAGGGEGANEMVTFLGLASKNSAKVVTAILKEMP